VKEGEHLGKYRVLRPLEANVWLAERREDFEQQAAVVFPAQRIAPEAKSAFQERRRKLAVLVHPAIPRFLDAGEASDDLSYNLFEFIPDEPVLAVARAQQWTLARRIAMALEYLDALAAAHRSLLAHGDLTGESFRVTSAGEARLSVFPAVESLADPVATDLSAAIGIVSNLIAESGVKKLPRDLQAILDKAHRPRPGETYASAYSLAQDLRSFLDRKPVSARKNGPSHRLALFARRHPELFFPAAALLATVLATAAYSFAMERAAQHSRDLAQSRLRQVQQLTYSLESSIYGPVSQLPNSKAARDTLIHWTTESLDSLAGESANDAQLRRQVAHGYQRLAEVLRADGQSAEAGRAEEKARALLAESGKRY
jgi:serine/threonine-protein kinase